ncbi:GNAT family N-acetyltransferase [Nocardia sp. NPDC020380]|uniref:GNAT family N-acetyltransferase n=1 Tax=Nocardia sp. NPDC020380 TaxID=3364309 RepID=UPI00378D3922
MRRLESGIELSATAAADHLLSSSIEPHEHTVAWASTDGSVAFGGSDEGPGLVDWLTVIGPGASELLLYALAELPSRPEGISVPRGTDLGGIRLGEYEQWDQMVRGSEVGTLALVPGEERVVAMTTSPAGDGEIIELLTRANPTHSVHPGDAGIEVWARVRDSAGVLVGCGAYCRRIGGAGWLGSVATLPSARGQSIGVAVSAWLTRRSLAARDQLCALHHWHPNHPARRIYRRLGYTTTHRMMSGKWPGEGKNASGTSGHGIG